MRKKRPYSELESFLKRQRMRKDVERSMLLAAADKYLAAALAALEVLEINASNARAIDGFRRLIYTRGHLQTRRNDMECQHSDL